MRFAMMHKTLANITEDYCLGVFSGGTVKDLAEQALDRTGKWHQRECPLKAPFVLWFAIVLSVFRYKSIVNVFKALMIAQREREPCVPLRPVTVEAIIHARERLGVEPLRELFCSTAEQIFVRPTFHGFRIWGIDGVDFTLQNTEANDRAFGRPGSSRGVAAFPKMKAVALISDETHQIRDCIFSPYKISERAIFENLIRHLGPEDILLQDRGFPSVQVLEKYINRGLHFLVRINARWKPRILSSLGNGDHLVEVTAKVPISSVKKKGGKRKKGETKRQAQRTIKLTLRLIEFQIGENELVRLLTDLLDPGAIPAFDLANLYHQRWENELAHDELKTHLVTVKHGTLDTDFRSKTPEGVLQEAYGMLIAYNLIRGLMVEAAELREISPLKLSFVDTLEVIESSIPLFEAASLLRQPFLAKRLLDDIADCRIDRPRRKRAYPRRVKVKMSNYKLKRPTDRGEYRDFQAELRMVERYQNVS